VAVKSKKKTGSVQKINRSNSAATNGREGRSPFVKRTPQEIALAANELFHPAETVYGDSPNFDAGGGEGVSLSGFGDFGNQLSGLVPRMYTVETYCQALADRLENMQWTVDQLRQAVAQLMPRGR